MVLCGQSYSQIRETIAFSTARIQDPSTNYNLVRTDQQGNIIWSYNLITDNSAYNYSEDFYIVCGYTDVVAGKITSNPFDYDYWLVPIINDLAVFIYPNPACNVLNVALNNIDSNVTINIYNLQMKLVATYNANNYINTLTLPALSNAVYFVVVRSDNNINNIQKLCVQQN